nr:hypothetical protein Iba_chr14bCG16670 [Ipomoea batatas]
MFTSTGPRRKKLAIIIFFVLHPSPISQETFNLSHAAPEFVTLLVCLIYSALFQCAGKRPSLPIGHEQSRRRLVKQRVSESELSNYGLLLVLRLQGRCQSSSRLHVNDGGVQSLTSPPAGVADFQKAWSVTSEIDRILYSCTSGAKQS